MSKYKVNQEVVRKSDGKVGIVRAREVNSVENYTEVKYLVDFSEGIDKWKVMTRKELLSVPKNALRNNYLFKTYEVGDGKIITMAAHVETIKCDVEEDDFPYCEYKITGRVLNIGFSVYNGIDEYDEKIGCKYAVHRCKNRPFVTMFSDFAGEFNRDVVEVIMDVKAKYIIDNIEKYYNQE